MITEIGHFALTLAFAIALAQSVVPLVGAQRQRAGWMALATPAAQVQFALIAIAFASLTRAYVVSDFSLVNVAANSHSAKPMLYKITGVWANHEGSMLLWVLILALFGMLVATFGRNLPPSLKARVLAVQGFIGVGFLAFILFTSNPFERLSVPPVDGNGMNPLLQDPGVAFHPPFLYLGYVGFSVAFAFAVAALLEGRVDAAWARWVRPWTLLAWSSLTLGIAMGSWWAYYELGWGGWWFWDPVENASFMPWLLGTALLHSAIVVEKRDTLKKWTVLLAIITFGLSLIGTFLVRSGVLSSVHAFAQDPERGVFILALLFIAIGGSLALYAWRVPALKAGGLFAPVSREGSLLLNNLFMATACATVFLGTLYPLFLDVLELGKVSVGPPYFNATFVPIMVPTIIAMAMGPLLPWKRGDVSGVLQRLRLALVAAVLAALAAFAIVAEVSWIALVGMALAGWLLAGTLIEYGGRIKLFRAPLPESLRRAAGLPRASYGMTLAHAGMAIAVAGMTGASLWTKESVQSLSVGESAEVAGFEFRLLDVSEITGPNYSARVGTVRVERDGREIALLFPEKRWYPVQGQDTSEAAIRSNGVFDLYAVLGEPDGSGGWVTRFYLKPLVPWIWIGCSVMVLGGLLSLSDRRLRVGAPRRARTARPVAPTPAPAGESRARAAMMRRLITNVPLLVFLVLGVAFAVGLSRDPKVIPSALLDRPVPQFELPALIPDKAGLASQDLKGEVTVVNVFASWCIPCRAEHPLWMRLAEDGAIKLVGINYKDRREDALAWLDDLGDPYSSIGRDAEGRAGIDWGVYGVPETFIIDAGGSIRYKHVGPVMDADWDEVLKPLIRSLEP